MTRSLTGRHVAALFIASFGVIVAVNLWMAYLAGSTFGGVVVQNSYAASQHFNRWLDEADAESRLGWQASLQRDGTDRVLAQTAGLPLDARVSGLARHPLGRLPDSVLTFEPIGNGVFASRQALPAGRWTVRLTIAASGHTWHGESDLK